jgi:hypothetical protein
MAEIGCVSLRSIKYIRGGGNYHLNGSEIDDNMITHNKLTITTTINLENRDSICNIKSEKMD